MSTWIDETKTCDYCHGAVSIFESLTEYGKHYHEACYIHRTQKEIEAYKKKWINKTMTKGDKLDLVDKYNLVQKLMMETTEFKGLLLHHELNIKRNMLTKEPDKRALYLDTNGCFPVLDKNGFPVFVVDETPSVDLKFASMRPVVERKKTGHIPKMLTVKDIPMLMESLP